MNKLPISAIIVGHNEASILENCLKSILFCDEIIYIDLESSDNSIALVESLGVRSIRHKRVPAVEIIHEEYVSKLKHDWVLIIDPDERVDVELYKDIFKLFEEGIPYNIGGIYVPWQFYFKKYPLKGTPWGGQNFRLLLLNKNKYKLSGAVHAGRNPIDPFIDYFLPYNGNSSNVDHHYWMNGFRQLIEKHRRYLTLEPESRYKMGKRSSVKRVIAMPFWEFKYAFFEKRGYKDRWRGVLLSIFWSWYQSMAELGLYSYQKKNK